MNGNPSLAWLMFQHNIKHAIERGAKEWDYVGELVVEMCECEAELRSSDGDISLLSGPVARELAFEMREYEKAGRPGGYDEVCAANVVLDSINATVRRAQRLAG